ncbi:hypothetical protein T484DRAFT_3465351 [Baffinella frigidus]|nr:hypothetical protein T484DRAFT_3465351 [Cryptophyta sp. CCMP2293]
MVEAWFKVSGFGFRRASGSGGTPSHPPCLPCSQHPLEEPRHVRVRRLAGERRHPVNVRRSLVRPSIQQQVRQRQIPLCRREKERRLPFVVRGVHARPRIEQYLREGWVPSTYRHGEV